jgi:hypothetical protein
VEVYWKARYLTVTGHVFSGHGRIEDRTEAFRALHEEIFPSGVRRAPGRARASVGHLHLAQGTPFPRTRRGPQRLGTKRSGPLPRSDRFRRLFSEGDTSDYDHDQSRADLALLCGLVKAGVQDPDQLDRLYRQSALMREKWDREDYRGATMDKGPRRYRRPDTSWRQTERPEPRSEAECGGWVHNRTAARWHPV